MEKKYNTNVWKGFTLFEWCKAMMLIDDIEKKKLVYLLKPVGMLAINEEKKIKIATFFGEKKNSSIKWYVFEMKETEIYCNRRLWWIIWNICLVNNIGKYTQLNAPGVHVYSLLNLVQFAQRVNWIFCKRKKHHFLSIK